MIEFIKMDRFLIFFSLFSGFKFIWVFDLWVGWVDLIAVVLSLSMREYN